MKLTRPVQFGLIAMATVVFVLYLLPPVNENKGATADVQTLLWAKDALQLLRALGFYVAFCIFVLAHAITTKAPEIVDAEPGVGR